MLATDKKMQSKCAGEALVSECGHTAKVENIKITQTRLIENKVREGNSARALWQRCTNQIWHGQVIAQLNF